MSTPTTSSRTQELQQQLATRPVPDGAPAGQAVATVKADPARDLLRSMESEFEKCLPELLPLGMFTRIALTGIRKTPDLLGCTRASLLGALLECARLGLSPCTEEASLVPFKNGRAGGRLETQLIVGYQGYVQLMYRSGQVQEVICELVHEADEFEYSLGDGGRFYHRPNLKLPAAERGEPWCAYAFATLRGGGRTKVVPIVREQALQLQAKYGVKPNSPWRTNFNAMWLKTPLRQVQKFAPKSPELRRALAADGATFDLGGVVDREQFDDTDVVDVPADEARPGEPCEQQNAGTGWDDVTVAQPGSGGRR